MNIAVLSTRTGWHTDELQRAIAERGHTSHLLPYESLVARLGARDHDAPRLGAGPPDLLACDAVIARIIPNGSLEQIIYRVDALHCLEDSGVTVMNPPRAIERTVDKFYTSALLEQAGLATPQTVVCERAEDAAAAFRALGDVIVKPLFGSMGLGMVRVSDEETAWRVFRALEAIRGVYYLQRAIPHAGRDVRAFVVGDRVVAAIERRSAGWRTNISRGGEARSIALSAEWRDMALRAARAVGAEYAGVDLLPADDGTVYVLEVNGIPGWRGLQTATSFDVAGALIDHVVTTRRARAIAR
ncbi:MAG: ATP-grasp domain-containing protein [Gemmatimonadaceae bacterium]